MTIARTPSISVVMATRNRADSLPNLVTAVMADESVRHLVVVIDGDDAQSVETLTSLSGRFRRLRFRQIPHAGHLRALEVGIAMTDAEVVLLLDDDVMPSAGLAAAHARSHTLHPNLVLVGAMPVQLPDRRAGVGSLLYARDYEGLCDELAAGAKDVLANLWMGNVSLRRSHCVTVGLASREFTASYHTDQELGIRLAAAGLVGRYDPSLAAVHLHRRNNRAFLNDARRRGAGVVQLHAAHPELGPVDAGQFTDDLPGPLGGVVARMGRRPLAYPAARAMVLAADGVGLVGAPGGRMALAKLARRLMLVRGATAGEPDVATSGSLVPA
ncbi:MAG: glycosyltransferase [Acidimicrobiales bacterium]